MDLKRELIKTTKAVRKKYMALKRGIVDEEEILKKKFRPIVEPITEIVKNIKDKNKSFKDKSTSGKVKSKSIQHKSIYSDSTPLLSLREQESENVDKERRESIEQISDSESEGDNSFNDYIKKSIKDAKNEMDHTYGVYLGADGNWMIGDGKISYSPTEDVIEIKNHSFTPTRGLLELIFKKKPNKNIINKNDLSSYKDILLLTNAHLVRYSEGEKIQVTNTLKYKNYIKTLFKKGSGLKTQYMKLQTYPCAPDYVHYDDINEIVERLRILKASEAAGNNSHNNEIINIISELREKGVIY